MKELTKRELIREAKRLDREDFTLYDENGPCNPYRDELKRREEKRS